MKLKPFQTVLIVKLKKNENSNNRRYRFNREKISKQTERKRTFCKYFVRNKTENPNEFLWNTTENFIEDEAFTNVESIIHFLELLLQKMDKKYKKELHDSRVETANFFKICKNTN
jgi:hypothetical protein